MVSNTNTRKLIKYLAIIKFWNLKLLEIGLINNKNKIINVTSQYNRLYSIKLKFLIFLKNWNKKFIEFRKNKYNEYEDTKFILKDELSHLTIKAIKVNTIV